MAPQLHTALDVTCCTSSILHLCAVSIDRYYAIVKEPLLYQERSTKRRTAVIILLAWLTGLLVGSVSVFFAKEDGHNNPDKCEFEVSEF